MPNILIMDDDCDLTAVMEKALGRDGLTTQVAHDGPSAIAAATEHPADLILLDVNVPGADGFEVCRAIRASERGDARATILMVTGLDDISSKLKAFAAGADDYLVKPLDLRELRSRVSRWVGTRTLQDELVKRRRRDAIQEIVISICHEINNPLQVAVMGVELALNKKTLDAETVADLTAVRDHLTRITDVLGMLRVVEDKTVPYVGGDHMINVPRSS